MTSPTIDPECFNRQQIADCQLRKLQHLLAEIVPRNPFWTAKLASAGIQASDIRSLDDLRRLPFTTKSDVVADHVEHQPYGTNLTYGPHDYARMHQTSGTTGSPVRWLDTPASWNWILSCWAQIYRMMELRPDDRLCFPFSFGPFIGFWAAFEGANRLGNLCLAGGGMTSQARLKLIADNQATIVCCTPTYALRLAEVAAEENVDLAAGSVRALVVAGEPGGSIPATRQRIEQAWGARVFDHWGMTEIGSLATECVEAPANLHMLETEVICEILKPGANEPTAVGEQGELVITNLGRLGSPLIRYRTGDLVQASTTPCACGRELLHLQGGILGRADDMVTIRGNNVFPSSIEAILREFAEVAEFRIEVRTERAMQHMKIEVEPTADVAASDGVTSLVINIARAIKDRMNFQCEVVPMPRGSLPRFELKGRRFKRIR